MIPSHRIIIHQQRRTGHDGGGEREEKRETFFNEEDQVASTETASTVQQRVFKRDWRELLQRVLKRGRPSSLAVPLLLS